MVNGPAFELEIGNKFGSLELDFNAASNKSFKYESTADTAKFTAILSGNDEIVVIVDAAGGFDPESKKVSDEDEFLGAIKLIDNPLEALSTTIFKTSTIIEELVVSSSYQSTTTSVLKITDLTAINSKLFENLSADELDITQGVSGEPTQVSSQDNWNVSFVDGLTDSDNNGIDDDAVAVLLDIFGTSETLTSSVIA